MDRKTILVAGATGFLGSTISHSIRPLCDRLILLGGSKLPEPTIHCDRHHSFRLPDLRLLEILDREKPAWVVHCAGSASVRASIEQPQSDRRNNVDVTASLYEAIAKCSPATRVVHFSSAAVYGQPQSLPISLETPTHPVSPYGCHKRECELIADDFRARHGIHTVNLRIFSSYGPGLRRQVLWDIFRKSRMGDPITLFGDGTETRDFVFSRDIANLVCKLVHASPRRIEAQPHHINVASGRSVQIKEVARMLLHQLGSQCGLQFSGQRSPGDPSRWSVDLQDQGEFSLTHPTPLEQGLAIYARWIRSITENNDADRVLATAG